MNQLAKAVQAVSDKHGISIFMFALKTLKAPVQIDEHRIAMESKATVLVNHMTPHMAYMLGMEIAKIGEGAGKTDFGTVVRMGIEGTPVDGVEVEREEGAVASEAPTTVH